MFFLRTLIFSLFHHRGQATWDHMTQHTASIGAKWQGKVRALICRYRMCEASQFERDMPSPPEPGGTMPPSPGSNVVLSLWQKLIPRNFKLGDRDLGDQWRGTSDRSSAIRKAPTAAFPLWHWVPVEPY